MAQAPVMPVWTDALIGDTEHLSAEQFGAYVKILLVTWRNNGVALPDDDKRMARICKVRLSYWRKELRPILSEFFTVNGTGWHQKRLEREWRRLAKWRANASKGGKSKARKYNNNSAQPDEKSLKTVTQNEPFQNDKPLENNKTGSAKSGAKSLLPLSKEASLPKDSESVSNSESLNAAREAKDKNEARNPLARYARLGSDAQRESDGAIMETPVGMVRPAQPVGGTNDGQSSLPSPATDPNRLDLHDQAYPLAGSASSPSNRFDALRQSCPPPKSPALKAKIRQQLASKHWRYLMACGRPDEAGAYVEAIQSTGVPPQDIFDAVDRRMRRAGWDDMRQWRTA